MVLMRTRHQSRRPRGPSSPTVGVAMLLHNRAHGATTLEDLNNGSGPTPTKKGSSLRNRFEAVLPKIVLGPTLIITLIFVYGFIAWTTVLSFTRSRAFANFH